MSRILFACYGTGGSSSFVVDGAKNDGTNDSLRRTSTPVGLVAGKTGIISVWWKMDAFQRFAFVDGFDGSSPGGFEARLGETSPPHYISIIGQDSSSTNRISMRTVNAYTDTTGWHHLLASWDCAQGAGSQSLYIDDVSDKNVITVSNANIAYTAAINWGIGNDENGGFRINGALAEVYFAPNQFLDFSVESNRRKFISATGKPVDLGDDGSTPTGVAPLIYLHLDDGEAVANIATNRGTGGNFTIAGTFETSSTSPSD